MIQNQFEPLFGEIHTRSIGDTFNAEHHGISSGWNHEFSMIHGSSFIRFHNPVFLYNRLLPVWELLKTTGPGSMYIGLAEKSVTS